MQLNGVDFTRTGDPAKDLQTYATARGISESEAKKELEAEFGIPKAIESSKDEDVSISTSSDDLSLDDTSEETDSEFTKDETGRKELQETIEYWNAKLKEATDAKDSYGVTYAQEQCKKYQQMAYNWDHNIDTDSTTSSTSTTSDTSSTMASDREHLENEIKYWNARLKEATDAKDSYGVTYAQEQCKKYQQMANEWDESK